MPSPPADRSDRLDRLAGFDRPAGEAGTPRRRSDARRNRDRVLAAAEAVFAERGPSASTSEIARRAGLGVGTVFRHFPTKAELLQAILDDRLQRFLAEADELAREGDPATAFFTCIERLVDQAADKKSYVDLLVEAGVDVTAHKPMDDLQAAVDRLLRKAKKAGAVRSDVRIREVMALVSATSRAALAGEWDRELRRRTLAIVFAGLRP